MNIVEYGVVVIGPDTKAFLDAFWGSWEAERLPRDETHWTPSMVMSAMVRFKKRRAEAGRPFKVWIELAE